MGIVHQLTEALHIVLFQCLDRLECAAVLIDRMACASALDLILDYGGVLIKLRVCQFAEGLDRLDLLQSLECRLALHPTLVIRGRDETVRLVRVRDDDTAPLEVKLAVAVLKRIAVEQDCTILLPHPDRELIHDAAVHSHKLILRLLRELHDLHAVDAQPKLIV